MNLIAVGKERRTLVTLKGVERDEGLKEIGETFEGKGEYIVFAFEEVEAREVEFRLAARARYEYSETALTLEGEDLDGTLDELWRNVDATAFSEDAEYWERGDAHAEKGEAKAGFILKDLMNGNALKDERSGLTKVFSSVGEMGSHLRRLVR